MNVELLDKQLSLFLNSLHCPASDFFWLAITQQEIWYVAYAVIAAVIIRRIGWKKGLICIAGLVLSVVVTDQTCNIVKHAVMRVRPGNDIWMVMHGVHVLEASDPTSYGFFSAHAANCFGFAMGSSLSFKLDHSRKYTRYTAAIFIWATLVALSRVFVARHFLGDVTVGAVVGTLLSWLVLKTVTILASCTK